MGLGNLVKKAFAPIEIRDHAQRAQYLTIITASCAASISFYNSADKLKNGYLMIPGFIFGCIAMYYGLRMLEMAWVIKSKKDQEPE